MMPIKYTSVTILGFMVEEFHLHGEELIIYAIIFQFTMQPRYYYTINYDYIKAYTNISFETIDILLEHLKQLNLIEWDGMQARAKYHDE